MKSSANQQKRMRTTFLISAVSLILLCLSRPALGKVEMLDSWLTGQLHPKPSGTDRALIYIQHAESNSPLNLSDVTYGGYSMTKVVDYNCNLAEGYVYAAAFILLENDINLATTTRFTPTWSGTPPQSGYTFRAHVFLQNVNQSAPTGATGIGESLYNPATTPALVTNYGDMVFLGATCGNAGTYTLNNGFIEGKDQNVSPNLTGVTGYKSVYGSNETPSATYSGSINQQMIIGFVVNSLPPDPNTATKPVPFDGTDNVSVFADLSWVPPTAYTPTSYDVYFGTNPDAHSNPKNTVDINSFDPPGDLELGTTYYWAVDSNDDGIIYASDDWSFTTTIINPYKALNPNPSNGEIHVPLSSVLSWDDPVGFTPTSYDVYLGTNPDAHNNPVTTVYTNSYDPPGDLAVDTIYYWAIDPNDAGTIYTGDDWSFTTIYYSTNILINPSFESGTNGWTARGNGSISAVTSPVPYDGTFCARAYGRTATWHGIQQDVMNKMVIGETYTVSGWVMTSTSASSNVKITFQQTDGSGTNYYEAATGTADNSGWVQISGSFTLNVTGTLTGLLVYVEGPDSGIDIYVDDIIVYGPSVVPIDPNKATNPTPNNGTNEISVSTGLSWNAPAGFTPTSYDVYLGTDANAHNNPHYTVYTNSYDPPGDLAGGEIYYWAVDSNDAGTVYAGDDWHFSTILPNVRWRVDARCFSNGPPGTFDQNAVKDPSIVYAGGKWHLFYTSVDRGSFRMGYANAETIKGLGSATHTFLNNGVAPQVFWFEAKGLWYLIYQYGPLYSTNTDISDPNGWTDANSLGFSDGTVDYWLISDGNNVYCFYSPLNGSYMIKRRSTTVADFPNNWSQASYVCSNVYEAPHVYKNIADGKYYMMVEDVSRHQELWTANTLDGSWTRIMENWAGRNNFVYKADHWTDQASHGEIIRAGINERMEISDIKNNCEILIQGVTDANANGVNYPDIPYDLGLIRLCPSADLNQDCDVNFVDFAAFGLQWRQPPGEPYADIEPPGGDGIVDMNDLALFTDNWLWGEWEY